MTRLLLPFFLLISTSNAARYLTTSPENDRAQNTGYSTGRIAMNVDVGSKANTKEPGKSSDEGNMPASGSFPVKIVGGEEKRFENGKVLPVAPSWRPINRHFNRMQLIRRTFPAYCRHRGSRSDVGAEIQSQRSPDAISFPAIDGDDAMIGELEHSGFIFHRRHDEEANQIMIVHALWKKMINLLADL